MRRFRYWIYYFSAYRTQLIMAAFLRRGMNQSVLESVDGIKIVDTSLRRNIDQRFHVDTVAALQLIKSVDSRRYRRLQREIDFIVNGEGFHFVSYNRPVKMCDVDYNQFDFSKHPEWYLWWYATALVHEATHGTIHANHIHYTPKLRARIERLCVTEAGRFATRADTADRVWSHTLVGEFDEKKWHKSWYATRWQRIKQLLSRILEERRKLRK